MSLIEKKKTVDNTLLNLKILGCIKKMDKLVINKDNLEIETCDYLTPVRRWWFGRDRNETMESIKLVINNSFILTDKTLTDESKHITENNSNFYFDEENTTLLQRFVFEMSNARKGLITLRNTYSSDTRIVSELDILVEQLGMRIDKINRILKIDVSSISVNT